MIVAFDKIVSAFYSERDDDELIDDLEDAIEELDVDDYDYLSWYRGDGTYIVVFGVMKLRNIVYELDLELISIPHTQAVDQMRMKGVTWIVPEGKKASQEASDTLDEWFEEMLAKTEGDDSAALNNPMREAIASGKEVKSGSELMRQIFGDTVRIAATQHGMEVD